MGIVEQLEAKGIDLKRQRKGQIKTVCPWCSQDRRNKKDTCLSVNIDTGLYNCHHCGVKGGVFEREKKEYTKPVPRLEKLSKEAIQFFENRGISNNTLLRFKITEAKEWMPKAGKEIPTICFNYYRDGELVNIKFRGKDKDFKLSKDSELIFYNIDAVKDEKECVIVEGEIDCLSLHECGVFNVISVPNGASKGNQKLEYLDNCYEYFECKEKVILMVDGDDAGNSLREELARRIGKDKCYLIDYPEGCKDANEVLLKYGKDEVVKTIKEARDYPIEGVITMDDMFQSVVDFYTNGYPKGATTGIFDVDEHISFYEGQLTIVTGVPGSGKSEFIDEVMVNLTRNNEWSWGVVGFESPSNIHVTKLAEKHSKKAFAFRNNPSDRMNQNEFERAIVFIDKYFHFINIDEVDVTIEGIIEKATELVKRKGIKGLVIDPWNYIEQKRDRGQSETDYVNICLTKLIRFLKVYGVHGILIAHPTKLKKENGKYEVPTLYNISGSAHFFNKTHNGLSVWRDFDTNEVEVHIQKVKFYWLGKIGMFRMRYDKNTRQYVYGV